MQSWKHLLRRTESLVSYSSSLPAFNRLLGMHEFSSLLRNFRKLLNTTHPVSAQIDFLINKDASKSPHIHSLFTLLLSKCVNNRVATPSLSSAAASQLRNNATPPSFACAETLENQQRIAEVLECVFSALSIHRGIIQQTSPYSAASPPPCLSVDHATDQSNAALENEAQLNEQKLEEGAALTAKQTAIGNKMAILGGDLLFANASTTLADTNNTRIIDSISESIGFCIHSHLLEKNVSTSSRFLLQKLLFSRTSQLTSSSTFNLKQYQEDENHKQQQQQREAEENEMENDEAEHNSVLLEKWKRSTFLRLGCILSRSCRAVAEFRTSKSSSSSDASYATGNAVNQEVPTVLASRAERLALSWTHLYSLCHQINTILFPHRINELEFDCSNSASLIGFNDNNDNDNHDGALSIGNDPEQLHYLIRLLRHFARNARNSLDKLYEMDSDLIAQQYETETNCDDDEFKRALFQLIQYLEQTYQEKIRVVLNELR